SHHWGFYFLLNKLKNLKKKSFFLGSVIKLKKFFSFTDVR
ncbi:unnamed protein product, partial [Staurois parvus]